MKKNENKFAYINFFLYLCTRFVTLTLQNTKYNTIMAKVYQANEIKNVAMLGGSGSGKTTLMESTSAG